MRPKPYIGITGFTKRSEVEGFFRFLPNTFSRLIMVGVLASEKTIRGIPNKHPHRYPTPSALGDIFIDHPRALNLVHYHAHASHGLIDDLMLVQTLVGDNCHGFQLNIRWPDPKVLRKYRAMKDFGLQMIVLQCGKEALAEVGRSGKELKRRLEPYLGCIDYVLIDPSGGRGEEFDIALAYEYFSYLDQIPGLGYVIAGGLEARNVGKLEHLLPNFPSFSVDTESGVRDSDDDLDLNAAYQFAVRSEFWMKRFAGKKIYSK